MNYQSSLERIKESKLIGQAKFIIREKLAFGRLGKG